MVKSDIISRERAQAPRTADIRARQRTWPRGLLEPCFPANCRRTDQASVSIKIAKTSLFGPRGESGSEVEVWLRETSHLMSSRRQNFKLSIGLGSAEPQLVSMALLDHLRRLPNSVLLWHELLQSGHNSRKHRRSMRGQEPVLVLRDLAGDNNPCVRRYGSLGRTSASISSVL